MGAQFGLEFFSFKTFFENLFGGCYLNGVMKLFGRERESFAIFLQQRKIYFWSTFHTLEHKLHTPYVNDQGKLSGR